MNKLHLSILIFLLSIEYSTCNAQDFQDLALLFGQSYPNGSARIQGIGGSQISLGGDISNAYGNPAGLGMFNRSVFSMSLGLDFLNSDANYLGTTTPDSKANFNIPNIGAVIYQKGHADDQIKSGALGITLNRTSSFNNRTSYSSRNNTSSILDYFLDYAQGIDADIFYDSYNYEYDYPEALAVRTQLIFPSSDIDSVNGFDDEYITDIYGLPKQSQTIETSGSMNQLSIGYGANYDDVLFFGGNIGITSINYQVESTFNESSFIYGDTTYINPLNSLTYEERLTIEGGGINAILGVIYRPIDQIQIGGTFATPTYYTIEDKFDRSLFADYVVFDDQYAESNIILSNYNLTTPLKLSGGMTYFVGNSGFISADVEMINYGKSKLSSQDFSTAEDNQLIRNKLSKSVNYRIGGEYRYDIFMIRAGYAHYDLGSNGIYKGSRNLISGGLGIRINKYNFDLAIINSSTSSSYSPYQFYDGSGPVAEIKNNITSGVITFGVNF